MWDQIALKNRSVWHEEGVDIIGRSPDFIGSKDWTLLYLLLRAVIFAGKKLG
jgi:hypothetical protein